MAPTRLRTRPTRRYPPTRIWEPDLTHRAGLEIRIDDALNPDNPTMDIVPSGGAGSGHKAIADTNLCNNCHQRLSLHGGGRFTVEYCVTCHNDQTRDQGFGANSTWRAAHPIIEQAEDACRARRPWRASLPTRSEVAASTTIPSHVPSVVDRLRACHAASETHRTATIGRPRSIRSRAVAATSLD